MKLKDKYFLLIGGILYITFRLLWNNVGADDTGRLSGALSVYLGKGYNYTYFDIESWAHTTKAIAPMWPALFSHILAWLTPITQNIYLSYLILEISFILLFLRSLFRIITYENSHKWIRFLFIFFCIGATFTFKIVTIDLYALTLLTYVFYVILNKGDLEKASPLTWVYISLLLSLPCLFRFNYYAIAFIPALALFSYGILKHEKSKIGFAFLASAIPVFFILVQSAYINQYSTSPSFLSNHQFSLFWSNLLLVKPPITTLLLNLDTEIFESAIQPYVGISNANRLMVLLNIFFVSIELCLIGVIIKKAIKHIRTSLLDLMLIIGILITFGSLYALSLVVEPLYFTPTKPWTFVAETRYFVPALLMTLILILRHFTFSVRSKTLKQTLIVLTVPILLLHTYRFYSAKYDLKFEDAELFSPNYSRTDEADIYVSTALKYRGVLNTLGYNCVKYTDQNDLQAKLAKIKSARQNKKTTVCIIDDALSEDTLKLIAERSNENAPMHIIRTSK